jgi:hypothetical protein
MMSNRPFQILLLALALIPVGMVAVTSIYLLLYGETDSYNWKTEMYAPAIIQVASIVAFGLHADSNKRLAPGEASTWALQFIAFVPFGMIRYWGKHVWGKT